MGYIIKVLEGFSHQADRRIMGITVTRGSGREWCYSPVVVALESMVLHPIMEYIRMWQATIA